jgi:hypothetical protein
VYVKFIGAGICFLLSLFNVLGAVRQIPVKTTLGNSSRPTVAQIKPPGTSLHWLSGGVFFAASIGLIAWAILEYNSNIDLGIDSTEAPAPVVPPMPNTDIQMSQFLDEGAIQSQQLEDVKPEFKNLVPFRRPTSDGSVPITPEQFKNALEDDIWSD